MKTVQKLSLLTLALLVAGCNEKVSPELQSSSATTPDNTIIVPPSEYYFSVTDASPTMLNYKLHKTGSGNAAAKCEVKNTTGLSADIFSGDPASNDITCFFEAEELSLFHQGMSFQINASANTCDYVGYKPFSFYDSIPGDSSDTLTQVTCANDTTNSGHVAAAALADGVNLTSAMGAAGCNDWVSEGIEGLNPGTRNKFRPASDDLLCRFNYIGGDQCDIGEITVNEYVVTYTPPGDDPATQPAILKSEFKPRVVTCGGKVTSCVKGAIELVAKASGSGLFTEITQSEINKEFKLKYELPKLIGGDFGSNKRYANYRRNLASKNIDFGTSTGLLAPYTSSFGITAFARIFDPSLMDNFASNKRMDGTELVTTAMLEAQSFPGNTRISVPLAADPYLGLAARVSPFYTYYCFDTAFDIKARIRMVVRDWDRVYPSASADLELISDIWRGISSRQDNASGVQLPDENDTWIPYNDLRDFDDKIPMLRTPGAYSAAGTVWQPVPTATYVDGWFNPSYFTNNGY